MKTLNKLPKQMKTLNKLLLLTSIALSFCASSVAEDKNPFFDRNFWREKPNLEVIQKNIDEGHSLTDTNYYGFNALNNAVYYSNDLKITKLLIENGADIHKKVVRYGRTPAFWAVGKNNFKVLKYLVSKGAKIDFKDKSGYNLIMYAARSGASDQKIYDFLLKKELKFTSDDDGKNALLLCLGRNKETKMIDYFLAKGLSIHNTDKDGNGVFNYASRHKDKALLEFLIDKGVSYKPNPKTGENAFTFATRGRGGALEIEFLQYLEGLGLDPTAVTKGGSTCLSNISYSEKNLDIFKYFIEKGVDPNGVDSRGNTPLLRACHRNTKEVISYLLSFSKDINYQNKEGYSALGYAIRRNKPEIVEYLIEKGADTKVKDDKSNDLGAQLVNSYRGSDMKMFNQKMQILIKHGYKPKKASVQNGNSLLQVAIRNENPELVKELINMKIPINHKNYEGYTPLQVAVMTAKDDKLIKRLLVAGADTSIKTEFGESAYELAQENETLSKQKISLDFLK